MKLSKIFLFFLFIFSIFPAFAGSKYSSTVEEITGTLKEVRMQLNSEITGATQGYIIEFLTNDNKKYTFGINTNHKMWSELGDFAEQAIIAKSTMKARFDDIILPDGTHSLSLRSLSVYVP